MTEKMNAAAPEPLATSVSRGEFVPAASKPAPDSPPSSKGRVESLDGVRTFAVLAVMLVHAGFPGSELGWLGVDIFFALSGFLITTLLCAEKRRKGRVSLPKFWARRFLRLMPAYWLYVGTITIWICFGSEKLTPHGGWTPGGYLASLWLYFVNYLPQGGIWVHQFLSLHLWSLAVEEQFYFLWPIVISLAFRSARPYLVAWALVLFIVIRRSFMPSELLGLAATLSTRGIGIVLGCAAAMTFASGYRPRWLASAKLRWSLLVLIALSLTLLTILCRHGLLDEERVKSRFLPELCVLFTAFIATLWYGPQDGLTGFLASRPMAYLGQISYGLYLYHLAARAIVWELLLPGHETWNKYTRYGLRVAVYMTLTVVMASFSYYAIERRFLVLKDKIH